MKKSSSVFVAVMCLVSFFYSVAALGGEQYQAEVSVDYSQTKGGDYKAAFYGLSGEVFFEPVRTDEHAYAEAAFLERIGSVRVMAYNLDTESGGFKGDGHAFGLGINYAKPNFPLAISAFYFNSSSKLDAPLSSKGEADGYDLSIGNYFLPRLLAGITYSRFKAESTYLTYSFTSKDTEYSLFAKYVHELGQGRELSLGGTVTRETYESSFGGEKANNINSALGVNYYFNRSLSAGIDIKRGAGEIEGYEGMTYGANVRYFITPRFSVSVVYDKFFNKHNDEGFDDEKSYEVALAARF
jgi:hypothetical protein